jgi:ornithine cyclodeaminase/alanine dehydrogenase-like protein (mu-crystallin family)
VRYFDAKDVRERLAWDALISAMEAALTAYSAGKAIQPLRTVLTIEKDARYFGVMPAAFGDVMGVKAVSVYPANEGTSVPTHNASIVLFDTQTGEPLAAMDGTVITEMRTAAVSAAVTKHVMTRDARILAILGSGVQARAHLEALSSFQRFADVRVWSRTPEHLRAFAARYGATASPDPESAVRGADVVVVATNATQSVLEGNWLKPGAHVNAVGANRPTWRELDNDAMRNTLIVDARESALAESGDVILSKAPIYAEAGELFSGIAAPISSGRTTVFKSLGLAVEDLAAAKLVLGAPLDVSEE